MDIIDETEVHPLSIMQYARRHEGRNPKYEKALKPYIEEFRRKMKDRDRYDYVIIEEDRIRDILGFPLNTFSIKTITDNIKVVLWKYDMYVRVERRMDGKRLFNLRRRQTSDSLPCYLQPLEDNERSKLPRM